MRLFSTTPITLVPNQYQIKGRHTNEFVCRLEYRAASPMSPVRILNSSNFNGPSRFKIQEGLLTNVQEYIHVTKLFVSLTSNSHSHTLAGVPTTYLWNSVAAKIYMWKSANPCWPRILLNGKKACVSVLLIICT